MIIQPLHAGCGVMTAKELHLSESTVIDWDGLRGTRMYILILFHFSQLSAFHGC